MKKLIILLTMFLVLFSFVSAITYEDDFDTIDPEDFMVNWVNTNNVVIDRDTDERIEVSGAIGADSYSYPGLEIDATNAIHISYNASIEIVANDNSRAGYIGLMYTINDSFTGYFDTVDWSIMCGSDSRRFFCYKNNASGISGSYGYTGTQLSGQYYINMELNTTHAKILFDNDPAFGSPANTALIPISEFTLSSFNMAIMPGVYYFVTRSITINGDNFVMYVDDAPVRENITVWLNSPEDNEINNTGTNIKFNFNVTSKSANISDCRLITNESVWNIKQVITEVTNNSQNTITQSMVEGSHLWNVECCDIDGDCSFVSGGTVPANRTLTIDTTEPSFDGTNFTNETIIHNTNQTYQFNFSDDNFYSFLAILNGDLVLVNDTNIGVTSYQGNVTINHTDLGLINYLYIKAADGHTSQSLDDYDVSDGLFNDRLRFRTKTSDINIIAKDGSWFDTFSAEKKADRYTFEYEPSDKTKKDYTFIITSDNHIDIINKSDSKWGAWLITGDNWIDFYEGDKVKGTPLYKRISNTEVEVTIQPNPEGIFRFTSVGDLNIVEFNYTIYGLDVWTQHSAIIFEGAAHTPYLYVNVTNASLVTINAELIYNGTTYTPTKTNDTYNYTFSQLVNAPLISTNQNLTFWWNLTTPTWDKLIELNQTVFIIATDNCSVYNIRAINFTMLEDENNNNLNTSMVGYFETWITETQKNYFNVTWGLDHEHSLCIANDTTYNIYAQLEYDGKGGDYVKKTYYFYNATISNETQFVSLYSTANSTQVTFEVTDENDDEIVDVYIHVLKYDLGTNSHKINSILKTDSDGKDYGEITLFTTWYKFFLYKDGVLLLSTEPTKIVTTTKKFRVTLGATYGEGYGDLIDMITSLTFNNVTNNFAYTYTNPTGLAKEFCLKVTKRKVTADVLINHTCISTASGTILVNIGANPEDAIYTAYGTVSGSPTQAESWLEIIYSDKAWETYGEDGIFMTFFVKVTFAMIGIWNPIVGIALLVLADIIMYSMGIIQWGWGVLITYILMAAIVIWKIGRRQ